MTGTVASIQAQLNSNCIVARCRKGGFSVSLAGVPPSRLIIDLDKPGAPLGPADARCDYLFLAEPSCRTLWVAPVELKKGAVDASKAIGQLRAGARLAERLVSAHIATGARFRPVLAAGGGTHKAERNKMRANRVKFHGYSEPVRRIKCGTPLIDVFKQ